MQNSLFQWFYPYRTNIFVLKYSQLIMSAPSDLSSYCLHSAIKVYKQMRRQTTFVVNGGKRVITVFFKVRKTAKIRKRYNQVPHLIENTTWESNKNTINIINKSQEVSPFPAGDHKAAMNRQESMRNTRHKKRKWSTKEVPPWNCQ